MTIAQRFTGGSASGARDHTKGAEDCAHSKALRKEPLRTSIRQVWECAQSSAAFLPEALTALRAGIMLGLLLTFLTANGTTVSVTPSADSYMSQSASDSNFGTDFSNVAGALGPRSGHDVRRMLLRFDLNGVIPQGAVVNSVTLQVTVVMMPQQPVDSFFDLHRILRPWTEGEVTWNTASAGSGWEQGGATGGTDSVANFSASAFVTGLGPVSFSSSDGLVSDVQAWVSNPALNSGWLVMSEDEFSYESARRFGSRDDPNNAPILTIAYSIPALAITQQPQSQTNIAGGSATFEVQAVGAAPFSYQWFFNSNALPDATNSTLTLDNIQTNQSGPYFVTLSNASGSTNSTVAFLDVEPPPRGVPVVTVTSPTNTARFPALADIALSADATESNGVVVQVEFFLGTNSVGVISNTADSLLLPSVPAGSYSVQAVATDDAGQTGVSPSVNFSVFDPPTVALVAPPAGSRFPFGTNISLTASVTSKGSSVVGVSFIGMLTNNATGDVSMINLGSATNSPYTISWLPADAGDYGLSAIVFDDLGQTNQSVPLFVRVFIPELVSPIVTITNAPGSVVSNSPVTLQGTASDNIGLDHVEYQVSSGPRLSVIGPIIRADGTTNWSAQVALAPGPNLIHVRSVDLANNKSSDALLLVTYFATAPLTVQIVGDGKVVPDLDGHNLILGGVYTVQAKPGPGQLFLGWSGVWPTNNAKLSFIMTSNLVLTATFLPNPFPPVAGTYNGIFLNQDPNFFRPENAGSLRLQLTKQGAFSGKVSLEEGDYAIHGRFDPLGNAQISVVRRALPPIAFSLQMDLATGFISGQATTSSDGTLLSSGVIAFRNEFSGKNPAPQAGTHNFVLVNPADNSATIASGNVIISKSGTAQIRGSLATDQRFNISSVVWEGGGVPFYLSIGKGSDVFAGFLLYGAIDRTGEVLWSHQGSSSAVLVQQ